MGNFRLDLYYRLNVFPLLLPPLRERKEDVLPLANVFAIKFCNRNGKRFHGFTPESAAQALGYDWPGNIRELENLVEQAVVLNDGNSTLSWARSLAKSNIIGATSLHEEKVESQMLFSGGSLAEFDAYQLQMHREYLLLVLRQTGGRIRGKGGAAEVLNVKPTTLESRLDRMGISKSHDYRQ